MAEEVAPDAVIPWLHRRVLHVGFTAAIGVAFVGYFVGLGGEPVRVDPLPDSEVPYSRELTRAVGYDEMARLDIGPNAAFRSHLNRLVSDAPAPGVGLDPATRRDSRLRRAARRAFDGAPPTIPHPVTGRGSETCLACHGEGFQVDGWGARPMPHEPYGSCTQCHVEESSTTPGIAGLQVGSRFEGLGPTSPGLRAYAGAPPRIPHATTMRSDCLACHGPRGDVGLRTTHPERASCTQCHAPSAAFDQIPTGRAP